MSLRFLIRDMGKCFDWKSKCVSLAVTDLPCIIFTHPWPRSFSFIKIDCRIDSYYWYINLKFGGHFSPQLKELSSILFHERNKTFEYSMACREAINLCPDSVCHCFPQWNHRNKGRMPSPSLHFSIHQYSLFERVKGRRMIGKNVGQRTRARLQRLLSLT